MYSNVRLSLPDTLDREVVFKRLDSVLDPELDESILKLGFVESLEAEAGHLTIQLRLPTYRCAPNFSYLMAFDVRRELLTVESVEDVRVCLSDHFASEAIEAGVNAGKSFPEAFPDEAVEDLSQLPDLFLRKGYTKRQVRLLRRLRGAGLSFEEIAALRIEHVWLDDDSSWVRREAGQVSHVGPAEVAHRYLQRRAEIGLDCSPAGHLMTDLRDDPIPADRFDRYLTDARLVSLSLEANGALCSALLGSRKAEQH